LIRYLKRGGKSCLLSPELSIQNNKPNPAFQNLPESPIKIYRNRQFRRISRTLQFRTYQNPQFRINRNGQFRIYQNRQIRWVQGTPQFSVSDFGSRSDPELLAGSWILISDQIWKVSVIKLLHKNWIFH